MDMIGFPERLRAVIRQKKWTQKVLSEKSGITERTISRWMKKNVEPDKTNLDIIVEVLGCSRSWLVSGKGEMLTTKELEIATGETGNKYETLLDVQTKEPRPENTNLITVIDWLVDEYAEDSSSQLLLIEALLKHFPSFREFLEKKAKAPVAAGGSRLGQAGSGNGGGQEQAAG